MKVRKGYLVFFLLLLVAYVVFFPHAVGKELVVTPDWTTTLPALSAVVQTADGAETTVTPFIDSSTPKGTVHPFRLGDEFGFVDDAGVVHYLGRVMYGLALGSDRFVNYPHVPHHIVVQNTTGSTLYEIAETGYPMYLRDHLYVLSSQGNGIAEYDAEGKPVWDHTMGGIITSVANGSGLSAVGLLSGEIDVFNGKGGQVFQATSSSSTMPVILGMSMSSDGERLVVVSGIDPQIVTAYLNENGRFTAVDTRRLQTDFRRPVLTTCVEGSAVSVFEAKDGVEILNPISHALFHVSIPGALRTILSGRIEDMIVAGSLSPRNASGHVDASSIETKDTKSAHIVFFLPDGRPVLHFSFPAQTLYLHAVKTGVIWGADHVLYRVDFAIG